MKSNALRGTRVVVWLLATLLSSSCLIDNSKNIRAGDAESTGDVAPMGDAAIVGDTPAVREAIHVELLWDTPNDPDQTDEGMGRGADLDLHMHHPLGAGPDVTDGWFDSVYDCYWQNAHPDWGASGRLNDPSLDRDDSDGAGPENLNLNDPEAGAVYRVGVHYYADHAFGTSFATVRIYHYGVLVFAVEDVAMDQSALWIVAEIDWTTQAVTPITDTGGGFLIVPNVATP